MRAATEAEVQRMRADLAPFGYVEVRAACDRDRRGRETTLLLATCGTCGAALVCDGEHLYTHWRRHHPLLGLRNRLLDRRLPDEAPWWCWMQGHRWRDCPSRGREAG